MITAEGSRVQIKSRHLRTNKPSERQLSPFRSFDFDACLILLFGPAYDVLRAVRVPPAIVQQHARPRPYLGGNAWILQATGKFLDLGENITARFA